MITETAKDIEFLRKFIGARKAESYMEATSSSSILLVEWEFPRIELLRNGPDSFAKIFKEFIQPLAELMKVSQTPLIEELRGQIKIKDDEILGLKNQLKEFEIYKSAIRDIK